MILAIGAAAADVRAGSVGPVPPRAAGRALRGAQRLGHGQGYVYPHDDPHGVVAAAVRPGRRRRPRLLRAQPSTARSAASPTASSGSAASCAATAAPARRQAPEHGRLLGSGWQPPR